MHGFWQPVWSFTLLLNLWISDRKLVTDYSGLQCSAQTLSLSVCVTCHKSNTNQNWRELFVYQRDVACVIYYFTCLFLKSSPLGFHKAVDRSCWYIGDWYFGTVFLSAWYKYEKYENRFQKCGKKHLAVICLDSEMPYLRQSYALVYLYKTTVNTRGISKFLIYEIFDFAAFSTNWLLFFFF